MNPEDLKRTPMKNLDPESRIHNFEEVECGYTKEEAIKAMDNLREVARKLLRTGDSTEKAAECTGISLDSVEELAAQLNA